MADSRECVHADVNKWAESEKGLEFFYDELFNFCFSAIFWTNSQIVHNGLW